MLCRALAAWSKVKTWLTQHSPAILASLNPGASAAEVAATEKVLGHPLPLAMRCIYRLVLVCVCVGADRVCFGWCCRVLLGEGALYPAQFTPATHSIHSCSACHTTPSTSPQTSNHHHQPLTHNNNRVHNGQKLVTEQQSCEEGPPPDLLMGLFGTTCFYDHITSTSMVDLTAMAKLTRLLRTMRVSEGGGGVRGRCEGCGVVCCGVAWRGVACLLELCVPCGAVCVRTHKRDVGIVASQAVESEGYSRLRSWLLAGGLCSQAPTCQQVDVDSLLTPHTRLPVAAAAAAI